MIIKKILLFFIGLVVSSLLFAQDPGFRVPSRFFNTEAYLFDLPAQEEQIEAYINKIAPHRSQAVISTSVLAREIVHTSNCFSIDPYIFTALIYTESSFNTHAVSETGATGLTQFTDIALTEVNDQLGERGKAGAISSTIKFWQNLYESCIDPEWVPLWRRSMHVSNDKVRLHQKEILKTDPSLSLAYGALLLKLYWGRQSQLWEGRTDKSSRDLYLRALERYNGESNGRAQIYAQTILKRAEAIYNNQSANLP